MTVVTLEDWVAALRSGEYEQCKGALVECDEQSYCCIGVLGKVADPESTRHTNKGYDLLNDVLLSVGVDPAANVQGKLINMNDGCLDREYTFAEIADYLEGLGT